MNTCGPKAEASEKRKAKAVPAACLRKFLTMV